MFSVCLVFDVLGSYSWTFDFCSLSNNTDKKHQNRLNENTSRVRASDGTHNPKSCQGEALESRLPGYLPSGLVISVPHRFAHRINQKGQLREVDLEASSVGWAPSLAPLNGLFATTVRGRHHRKCIGREVLRLGRHYCRRREHYCE